MAVMNLTKASQQLGFRTTVTLRKMLQRGLLVDYVREGPDGRSTYLEMTPDALPPLRTQLQNHLQLHANSPLWEKKVNWTTTANEYLDHSQWGPPPWRPEQWQTLMVVIELAVESR